jgi:hypothetical protein
VKPAVRLNAAAWPLAGEKVGVTFYQSKQALRDGTDLTAVAILGVCHDPLPMAELLHLVARPFEAGIEIADETGGSTACPAPARARSSSERGRLTMTAIEAGARSCGQRK